MRRKSSVGRFALLVAVVPGLRVPTAFADDLLWIQKDELRQVKRRIRDEFTLREVPEDAPGKREYLDWLDGEVDDLLAKEGGYWSEFDSVDHPAISHHAKAFYLPSLLTRAWFTPGSRHHKSEDVWAAVEAGLRHYLQFAHPDLPDKKPHNWWAWDIGIPTHLLDVLILGQGKMSRDLFTREVATVAHLLELEDEISEEGSWIRSGDPVSGRTDMNRLWRAQLRMRLGVLVGNPRVAGTWSERAFGEMVAPGVGSWQSDGSYKFHGQCPMWAYGRGFIHDYAWLLQRYRGTSFGPTDAQLDHYAAMLEGYVNGFLYRGRINPAMIGREISRGEKIHYNSYLPYALAVMSVTDHPAAERFARLFARESEYVEHGHPAHRRQQAYGHAIARKSPPADPVNDIFAYPDSDFLQITRPTWSLGIKMHSNRNCGFESINRENLRGWFLSHGSMFHYLDGTEWDGAWSTIDWMRLPGTTVARDVNGANQSGRVGVVRLSADRAAACMELEHAAFRARKSWIVEGDLIICLGDGIEGPGHVETIVAHQPVADDTAIWIDGERIDEKQFDRALAARWIWFDGVGYVMDEPGEVRVLREKRTSDWSAIRDERMHGVGEVVTHTYVTIVIEHTPQRNRYAYRMMPSIPRDEVTEVAAGRYDTRYQFQHAAEYYEVHTSRSMIRVNWQDSALLAMGDLVDFTKRATYDPPTKGQPDHE